MLDEIYNYQFIPSEWKIRSSAMTTSLKDIRALLSPLYRLVFIKPKWRKMERASALKFATKLQKNSCFEGIIVHGAVN